MRSRVDLTLARALPPVERWLERSLGARPALWSSEFLVFGIKQAWACLFGGLLLVAIVLTGIGWPEGGLARYDFLFAYALALQLLFLAVKLERPGEALVIFVFHVTGTLMEAFKTEAGSWTYPEDSILRVGAVPLFSGFMYAAVGSYLARVFHVFDFRFSRYPPLPPTVILAAAIYLNFFGHHYGPDFRWALVFGTVLLYGRCFVHYRVWRWEHRMPLVLGFALVALFIFLAENVATLAGIWYYPDQKAAWRPVSIQKYPAWFLLMILSFVLVTLIHRPRTVRPPA
jgi:uncharacterized membrane protein YoaT (DUF817 family)